MGHSFLEEYWMNPRLDDFFPQDQSKNLRTATCEVGECIGTVTYEQTNSECGSESWVRTRTNIWLFNLLMPVGQELYGRISWIDQRWDYLERIDSLIIPWQSEDVSGSGSSISWPQNCPAAVQMFGKRRNRQLLRKNHAARLQRCRLRFGILQQWSSAHISWKNSAHHVQLASRGDFVLHSGNRIIPLMSARWVTLSIGLQVQRLSAHLIILLSFDYHEWNSSSAN